MSAFGAVLDRLPVALASACLMAIVARSNRLTLKDRDRALLDRAQALRWGSNGQHRAWAWGEGAAVLLLHGWGGGAAQMGPLAEAIADAGFKAIAVDLHGHGQSPGRRISFSRMVEDVRTATRQLAPQAAAWVGHSAGGMALMAARGDQDAPAYVTLNTPLWPYPPLRAIARRVAPSQAILDECARRFCRQFDSDAPAVQAGSLHQHRGQGRLLVVQDQADDQVDPADAQRISATWPDAQVVTTEALGHHKVLWDAAVHQAVVGFLRAQAAQSPVR
ncbi:MAG: alpha/beta fold hydrolase [Xanthomonadales bacterium]|nr:alpha/beta fold hydrolase [Xanthomonadales bacterium]